MNYRSDIDGLRAVAVLSVILFHSGFEIFSGGFVGVDIFFVISGYLITTLIHIEIDNGEFKFYRFYAKRAARLLPGLIIALILVCGFGFIFYNAKSFDNLGREIFFSSIGAANILFSQGTNYFAMDDAHQPLIHLWSLGVEEQFYFLWPIVFLATHRCSRKFVAPLACFLFLLSFSLSVWSVKNGRAEGYFLPQYRAFELLVGVITALILPNGKLLNSNKRLNRLLPFLGMSLIVAPIFLLDERSDFPGLNALFPCIGTALIIACSPNNVVNRILSHRVLVTIGLISYPLYLYHQPLISFIHFFGYDLSPVKTFIAVVCISAPMAWLTYQYIELPTKRLAHKSGKASSQITAGILISSVPILALLGITIAKSNGLEARFEYLNPFAYEVSQQQSATFHTHFDRGFSVSAEKDGKVLFVGDSVLQQYVVPIMSTLDLKRSEVDTVTRGGCVLLKNVVYKDTFSDISCADLRERLYHLSKTYEVVFISQSWGLYDDSVTNFPKDITSYLKWKPFLDATVDYFSSLSDNIVIIGAHPSVSGTEKIQPSITITSDSFRSHLDDIEVTNIVELEDSRDFFQQYENEGRATVIHPKDIFCIPICITHNKQWSYFSDKQHVTAAASEYIENRVRLLLNSSHTFHTKGTTTVSPGLVKE